MSGYGRRMMASIPTLAKGVFTLRDMYKQFQSVMKLGPLDKVMGMIPGMPDYLIPQNGDDEQTLRLRKFLYMMERVYEVVWQFFVRLMRKTHSCRVAPDEVLT